MNWAMKRLGPLMVCIGYFPTAVNGWTVTQVRVRVDSMQASMNASPSAPVMALGITAASGSGGGPLRRAATSSAKSA